MFKIKSFYLLYGLFLELIPQMNPMNWLSLFMFFSLVYLIFLIKLHFMKDV